MSDLSVYFTASIKPGSWQGLKRSIDRLNRLSFVEIAYLQSKAVPAASDLPPTTPDFQSQQGYLGAAPNGIDANYAWTFPGGKGAGVRYLDIENNWQENHEDLNGPFYTGYRYSVSPDHGTAVLGVISAQHNAYGMSGIAPDAGYAIASNYVTNFANLILQAVRPVSEGGVGLVAGEAVLLENATVTDPNGACFGGTQNGANFTLEADSTVFDAIKQVTSLGFLVIETAGNGSQDLDNSCYGGRFNRAVRDSGAILVAANSGPGGGPRSDTNYGSRIDVQGWGNNVATLGNLGDGTCTPPGYNSTDPLQQYTTCFAGTSAAGSMVAGAVLALQGIQKARNGRVYKPAAVRDMLRRFGTPQVPDAKLIGPLPNLRATLNWLRADDDGDGVTNGDELSLGRNPAVNEAALIGILNRDEP